MNRHSLVLLVVLIMIGVGMSSLIAYQRTQEFTPAHSSSEGGLIIGGGSSAQPSMETVDFSDSGAVDGAACP